MFPRPPSSKLRRIARRIGTLLILAIFGNYFFIQVLYPENGQLTTMIIKNENEIVLHQHDDVNRTGNITKMTSHPHHHHKHQQHHVNHTEKIDWNDYSLVAKDRIRTGLGEHGKPTILKLSSQEKELANSLYEKHKFNAFASSKISLQRSIGDLRDDLCRKANFSKRLPLNSVSIIIPFFNEPNSTILRTVFSIVNRAHPKLLKEIILVDDFSTLPELQSPLEEYIVKQHLDDKVKILRNRKRLGLISSRIAGADASSGRFLVFLDSHVEVNYNFLPPLIEPILLDWKSVTCPVVDNINRHDFGVVRIDYERNGFQWNMQNEHFKIFPKDVENLPAPFPTPVMMGGLFAIDRKWWETIGKYDPGLELWGGEQYEISFKTWMCGGNILNVPCSRVAHVFRHQLPYPVGNKYSRNLKRVASVWMDDYRKYVYQRLPEVRDIDPGDDNLTARIALRENLKCKSFEWYIKTVAVDVLYNYPVVEPPRLAWGALRPKLHPGYCVKFSPQDQNQDTVFVDKTCRRDATDFKFELSWRNTIRERNGIRCFETRKREVVSVHYFRINATVQQFVWDRREGWIVSLESGYCLHYDEEVGKMGDDVGGVGGGVGGVGGGGGGGVGGGGGGDGGGGGGVDMRECQEQASFFWTFDEFDANLVDQEWAKYHEKMKLKVV